MNKLTERQQKILEYVRKNSRATNREVVVFLRDVSRATIVRDLNILLEKGIIEKEGKGRNVYYSENNLSPLLKYFDAEEYFTKGPDERIGVRERFNFEIFGLLGDIWTAEETAELQKLDEAYRERVPRLSSAELKKEFERLSIELSWKSSQIEGNTYSLIDTEILLKESKEAAGHSKEEAVMILNHKNALEYIRDKRSDFKTLSVSKIENIHALIVHGLGIEKGLRKRPVGVVGTRYRPLDNEHQVREAAEKMIGTINATRDIFSKALFSVMLLSYIQPFEDGNKRTARLLGNAVLLSHGSCPLSYRSVKESDYKKAMILFYERNNIRFFKELFLEQFRFAATNYFMA
jgi:Fic family protein